MTGDSGSTFALAHVDGITPDGPTVQINVPAPLSLVAPVDGATNVTPATVFQWSASPKVARLAVTCPGPTRDDGYTRFFVVTERQDDRHVEPRSLRHRPER